MKRRRPHVRCFVSNGRTQAVIYAVVLRDHPGVVKVGRTMRWRQRRKTYDDWNLASGTGVHDCAVYCVTEEYVDLASLEAACLGAMNAPLVKGFEWFRAPLAHARQVIESVIEGGGLSYIEIEQHSFAAPADESNNVARLSLVSAE